MQTDTAVRDSLRALVLSRLLVWASATGAILAFGFGPVRGAFNPPGLTRGFGPLGDLLAAPAARWDASWYLVIAHYGYRPDLGSFTASRTAFFPLYPLALRVLSSVGPPPVLAGVLLSLAALALALYGIHRLTTLELGGLPHAARAARLAVALVAFAPMAVFLSAVYSESLYLALSVAAFLLARRSRWAWAGALAGLATLARVSGVMLLPALVILAWRAPNRGGALLRLALALPVMTLWPLFLGLKYHRPFVFLTAQRSGWDRHLSAAGPLGGAWDALVAGWHGVEQLVAGGNHFPSPDHGSMYGAGLNLEQLAYAVVLLALGVYAWRALGAAYGVFVLGSLALPFSDPVPSTPLLSIPRFALGVFPVFIALGLLGKSQRVHTGLLVGLTLFLGINLARWTLWIWVA